ncbi:MAG: hypothetical protein JO366_13510 [Methylobacteriaceae bacterium]|nr:hypothetical protein [Methylobacteriaceae bacterium]MBV9243817.1 hypothetical protein [Methylobacteriaceae bacterium]MBV9245822.1 hypothetical protein [Methylobacteriaceae bacterium]
MDEAILRELRALQGRANALEALTMILASIMVNLTCGDDFDNAKLDALLQSVRSLALKKVSQGSQKCRLESESAIDDLLNAIRLRTGLSSTPIALNA